jgi:hypothetical protein
VKSQIYIVCIKESYNINIKKLSNKSHRNFPAYYHTKSLQQLIVELGVFSIYFIWALSATVQLFIFFVVFQWCVFSEGVEFQSRNFIQVYQLVVFVFPTALCFLCMTCCQQQCFPQWTDASKRNYIKFTVVSTEIDYIYIFTKLSNCQILSVLLWGTLETIM